MVWVSGWLELDEMTLKSIISDWKQMFYMEENLSWSCLLSWKEPFKILLKKLKRCGIQNVTLK